MNWEEATRPRLFHDKQSALAKTIDTLRVPGIIGQGQVTADHPHLPGDTYTSIIVLNSLGEYTLPDWISDITGIISFNAICNSDVKLLDICNCYLQGDSGGPLVWPAVNPYILVGLSSWGASGCHTFIPNVYVRVSYYREWVRQHTGIWECCSITCINKVTSANLVYEIQCVLGPNDANSIPVPEF